MSTLAYNLGMIGVEDGGWFSHAINLRDIQTKYADIVPSQQVIEQMDRMSAKLSLLREVLGEEVEYAVCKGQ